MQKVGSFSSGKSPLRSHLTIDSDQPQGGKKDEIISGERKLVMKGHSPLKLKQLAELEDQSGKKTNQNKQSILIKIDNESVNSKDTKLIGLQDSVPLSTKFSEDLIKDLTDLNMKQENEPLSLNR